ncbi:MAG: heme-binding protein [Phormidium sp.]
MKHKYVLTLDDAKQIAAAAEAEAIRNDWNVAIAIVDDGGHLIVFHRIDDTQYGSCEIAILKARTAISLKRQSKDVADAVAEGKTGMLSIPGIIPLEGGLPLIVKTEGREQYVGAIGVSGVKSNEDGIVAKAGADFFANIAMSNN